MQHISVAFTTRFFSQQISTTASIFLEASKLTIENVVQPFTNEKCNTEASDHARSLLVVFYTVRMEKINTPPPPEIQFENAKTDVDYFLSLHYSKPNTSGSSHIDSEGLLRYNLWTFIPLLSCTVSVFLLMYKSSLCVQPRVSKGLMVAALWNNKWKQ